MNTITSKLTPAAYRLTILFLMFLANPFSLLAQEGNGGGELEVDVNVNNEGGAWYTQWWVWVIVGLAFILLLVAITSRGRRD